MQAGGIFGRGKLTGKAYNLTPLSLVAYCLSPKTQNPPSPSLSPEISTISQAAISTLRLKPGVGEPTLLLCYFEIALHTKWWSCTGSHLTPSPSTQTIVVTSPRSPQKNFVGLETPRHLVACPTMAALHRIKMSPRSLPSLLGHHKYFYAQNTLC